MNYIAFFVFTGAVLAQSVTVTNAASYIPAGLPHAAIAQGAMFVVKSASGGPALGPANIAVQQQFPLSTNLAGTSVQVTVGGKAVSALMYYALSTQIAAILPSSTPTGTGTVTVSFNDKVAGTGPITVVPNAFGVFTLNQGGSGDAIAFLNSDRGFLTTTHSAQPGEAIFLLGTGLGPISADESQPAPNADMPGVPLEVFIGGKSASILYKGRNSCCSSVDFVYVTVPAGVSGCRTPVIMKIGSVVSNTTTIPVAASGRVCAPTTPGISNDDVQRLLAKTPINTGTISLTRTVAATAGIGGFGARTVRSDDASGMFLRFNQGAVAYTPAVYDLPAFSSCIVSVSASLSLSPIPVGASTLDAGPSITIGGPAGMKSINQTSGAAAIYTGQLGNGLPGDYLDPGLYTLTGPGGDHVGKFTARLTALPALTWTNQLNITAVNRASGVTVTWTGGDPTGYVQISGDSAVSTTTGASAARASFVCTARTSDGSFTVPPAVLLALPTSSSPQGFAIPGSLALTTVSASTLFQATGLDLGTLSFSSVNSMSVIYQ